MHGGVIVGSLFGFFYFSLRRIGLFFNVNIFYFKSFNMS